MGGRGGVFWVYWGAHVATLEQAKALVEPLGAYGTHLLKFYPTGKPGRGGWLGFQRFEDFFFAMISSATSSFL